MKRLDRQDADHFFQLYLPLLYFVQQKELILKIKFKSLIDFKDKTDIEEKSKVQQKLYKFPQLFDEFITKNPHKLSKEDLHIIKLWSEHHILKTFWLERYLKDYAIFLDDSDDNNPKAYGAKSLYNDFEEFVDPSYLPVKASVVLLPFKGQIITDGFIYTQNVIFGRGISRDIKDLYNLAKSGFGIITDLDDSKSKYISDKKRLEYYLSSRKNIEDYTDEIFDLINRKPDLKPIYYQAIGKINALMQKKSLKQHGVKNIHFAILETAIIASGKNKKEVEKQIKQLLPKEKVNYVYYFKL